MWESLYKMLGFKGNVLQKQYKQRSRIGKDDSFP